MRAYTLLIVFLSLLCFGFSNTKYLKPFHSSDFIKVVSPFGKQPKSHGLICAIQYKNQTEVYEVKYGAPALSIHEGKVVECGSNKRFGNYVIIDHENGITARYFHMCEISVIENQLVKTSDTLGFSGSTGRTTVNSIGVELKLNNKTIDPKSLIY